MKKYHCILLIVLLSWGAVPAMSAPIKCGNARTDVEKLVCATPELRLADKILDEVYDDAIHKYNIDEKNRIVTEQVQWAQNKRSSCRDSDCLARSYASRILTITLNKEVEVVEINPSESPDRLADIKRVLQRSKIPLDIGSCDAMTQVWQPVGFDNEHRRMASYGAICNLPMTRAKVMVCNDYMVGKFHALIGFNFSLFELAKFVATYCKPGG